MAFAGKEDGERGGVSDGEGNKATGTPVGGRGRIHQENARKSGTVTSTMRRAAHASECARCGAGAGCSAIQYNLCTGTPQTISACCRATLISPKAGLEATQGQMDGFSSQLPCKCHLFICGRLTYNLPSTRLQGGGVLAHEEAHPARTTLLNPKVFLGSSSSQHRRTPILFCKKAMLRFGSRQAPLYRGSRQNQPKGILIARPSLEWPVANTLLPYRGYSELRTRTAPRVVLCP